MPAVVAVQIDIDGRPRPDLVRGLEISIEQDFLRADVAHLTWSGRRDLVDDPDLDPEARRRLRISLAYGQGVPVPTTLFEGHIARLGADFGADAVRVRATAYDDSLRLRQTVAPRSWANTSLASIVAEIARAHDLEPEIIAEGDYDASRIVFGYIAKKDETDWQFLIRHALLRGFEVHVRPGRLIWQPRRLSGQVARRWEYGGPRHSLRSFAPQWSTLQAKRETIVMAWDPEHKRLLVGQSRDLLQQGGRSLLLRERPVDPDDADRMAEAARMEAELEAVSGTAEPTEPDAGLVPGILVEVTGVGRRFSGVYIVAGVSHRIGGSGFRQQARLQTAVTLGEAIKELGVRVDTTAEAPAG